jgi:hypothetical protein
MIAVLPTVKIPSTDEKLFAVLLLEGAVYAELSEFVSYLTLPPRSLLGPVLIEAQSNFIAALKGLHSKATMQVDSGVLSLLYTPVVRPRIVALCKGWKK